MTLKSKLGPITAVIIVVAVACWLLIGGKGIITAKHESHQTDTSTSLDKAPNNSQHQHAPIASVQVETLHAQTVDLHLKLSGQTMAGETLELHNQYAGKITQLNVKKGELVKEGTPLLKIDTRTLISQLNEATLLVNQRRIELDGITKLNKSNLTSQVNLAEAKTKLATAQSNLKQLEIQLENATLTAPFTGVMNTVDVKQNQQLAKDATVGSLVSLDPLHIRVAIPQNKIELIQLGSKGNIKLESGYSATGSVIYVSAIANQESRTIPVELTIANPGQTIPAGITADVDFALNKRQAHAFSAALLTLDDAGRTAVKVVDDKNIVQLIPVTTLKSQRDQIWVDGLPDTVTLITVGQGFVKAGDKVDPHFQETPPPETTQTLSKAQTPSKPQNN